MPALDDLFRTSPLARALVDFDTHRFVSVNPAWQRLFGYSAEEARGRNGAELRLWADERDRLGYVHTIEASRHTGIKATRRRRRSGEEFDALSAAEEFEFEGRRYHLTTVVDITAQVRVDAMSQTLAAVFAASPVAHSIIDTQRGVFHDVNAACERMFGYTREEFIGRSGREIGFWPDEAEYLKFLEAVRASPAGREYAGRRRRKNGEIFEVRVFWDSIVLDGREYRLYSLLDITAEVRARAAEDRLAKFFRSSPIAHGISRLEDGTYVEANDAYLRLCGYSREEIIGRSSLEIGIWPEPAQRSAYLDAVRAGGVLNFPSKSRHKDGEVFDVLLSGEISEVGDERCLLWSVIDVSEIVAGREALERRVRERTAELEASNRELEAFSYSVSHDMRAPVRAIAGFATILLDEHGGELSGEAQRMLARIAGSAAHMGALIDALLDLSRLMRQPLERRPLDVSALAARLLDEARDRYAGRVVVARVQPGLTANADPTLLRSALANLVDNALKYTARRAEAVIEVGREGGEFFVRDNGEGFDMAYSGKLFKPFERLHGEDEFPGTGIGLATVDRILRRHGGRARAEGTPGKGATVYFTLPA